MSRNSRFLGVVLAALTVALLTVLGAGPAGAHALLLGTSPSAGSTLSVAPTTVTLKFDEAPVARYSTIHVTGPDGKRCDTGAVQVDAAALRQQLAGPRPAGRYRVDWRIVSDDGHPESGQFTFVVRAAAGMVETAPVTPGPSATASSAATGSATPSAGPSAGPTTVIDAAGSEAAASDNASGSSTGVIIGIVALVVVVGAVVAGLLVRRRSSGGPE